MSNDANTTQQLNQEQTISLSSIVKHAGEENTTGNNYAEVSRSVSSIFEYCGLTDLVAQSYQPEQSSQRNPVEQSPHVEHQSQAQSRQTIALVDLEQLEPYGQFVRLKPYCDQYGLDIATFAPRCKAQEVRKWETTSGIFYRLDELDRVRTLLRDEHARYLEKYLTILHEINRDMPSLANSRSGVAIEVATILDALSAKLSGVGQQADTEHQVDTAGKDTVAPLEQSDQQSVTAQRPYTTLLCDTNVLLDEPTMRWLLALYRAGAHFEWYTSRTIIRELLYVINEPHTRRLAFDVRYQQQYEQLNEDIRDIAERMAFLATLPKKDKALAKRTFLGSDPVDLHLHHAIISNDIEVLVTNDLQLFAHVSQTQRKQMPYRVWTADDCLAHLVQDNIAVMESAVLHLKTQYAQYQTSNKKQTTNDTQRIHVNVRLPYFHAHVDVALGLQQYAAQQHGKQEDAEQGPRHSGEKYTCPLCHETHQRVFSGKSARKNFMRLARALYELYPQLCNPQAQPFLKVYYVPSTSVIRYPQGKRIQYHAKIGATGISINTFDNEEFGSALAERIHDICPNCNLSAEQFVEQVEDVVFEYASQWQHSEQPDLSNRDFLGADRNRIATYLTAYGIDVREGDASFVYRPEFVCEQEGVVVYVDSCLWHSKDYSGTCKFKFSAYPLEHWQQEHAQERKDELNFRQQLRELGWRVVQVPHCQVLEKRHRSPYSVLFEQISDEQFSYEMLLRPAQRVFELEQRVRQLEAENQELAQQLSEASEH